MAYAATVSTDLAEVKLFCAAESVNNPQTMKMSRVTERVTDCVKTTAVEMDGLPRAESFLVLMIFAANSRPVDFCTHRRTIEKAPLRNHKRDT